MPISIDGPSRTITLANGETVVSAAEIYSSWKEWSLNGDNSKFLPAFRVIGGDPLGGGLFAGSYFFLRNDYGWLIKPPEQDIAISINGNLYAEDAGLPLLSSTDGNFNTSIRLQTSSLTQAVSTNGVSASIDVGAIADAVAARFSFTDGKVDAVVDGLDGVDLGNPFENADYRREFNRMVQGAIPAPPSSSAIWDAAPKWLKKPIKTKDHSDEIRTLTNKLDNLYSSIQVIQNRPIEQRQASVDLSGMEAELQRISAAVSSIEIPDGEESFASLESMSKSLKDQLDDVQIALLGVRDDIRELPDSIPEPDMSNLVTKEEVSALRDLVSKLENYDDAQALSALQELATVATRISNQASVVDQKVDLVLDNQLQLTF